MKSIARGPLAALVVTLLGAAVAPPSAHGAIAQTPLFVGAGQSVPPMVMLAMSNDHQLFTKAYNDYSDLDGDGDPETSYDDTIDYYGYFGSNLCYAYVGGANRFEPRSLAGGANGHSCGVSANPWSGNFLNWATMTRADVIRKVLFGGKRSTDTASSTELERAFLPEDAHAFAKVFNGPNVGDFTPYGSYSSITLCNVTMDGGVLSQNSTAPPRIRVAEGPWPRWAASEVDQCDWGSGGNEPDFGNDGLSTEPGFEARVEVCASTSLREGNCQSYSGGSLKPVGLLQRFGESGALLFGLLTGSYEAPRAGGVLRKNMGLFAGNATSSLDEVDLTNGVFNSSLTNSIVRTLNALRITEYEMNGHDYADCDAPGILPSQLGTAANRECSNWGNPLSEIYLETLRYLGNAGGPTSAFQADDSGQFSELAPVSWQDPYAATEYCAATNIVAVSTGVSSFDTDQLGSAADINGLTGSADVDAWTDLAGALEGVGGTNYFIGEAASNSNGQCTAKTVGSLSEMAGLCPSAPGLGGGFHSAGLAYYAHTQDIRGDLQDDQLVTTHGIQLARELPEFRVKVGNSEVSFAPACEANSTGSEALNSTDPDWRNCSLVDVTNLDWFGDHGSMNIQWEDSSWGNDYDMDAVVNLEFCVGSACIPAVQPDEIRFTLNPVDGAAGHAIRFGYTLAGTNSDGIHFKLLRQGGNHGSPSDFGSATGTSTDVSIFESSGGQAAQLPQTPLYYTAKYGGFRDEPPQNVPANYQPEPDLTPEWDSDGDGLPDRFHFADNPARLEASLTQVFSSIIQESASSAPVATNTGIATQTSTRIFQPVFITRLWYGQLLSLPIGPTGAIQAPQWDAGVELASLDWSADREIITATPAPSGGVVGIPFRWNSLSAGQQTALHLNPSTASADSLGEPRLEYLRGNQADESSQGGPFRTRPVVNDSSGNPVPRLLGDVVNSAPVFVGDPALQFDRFLTGAPSEQADYTSFVSARSGRTEMIYAGANDGMVHGFDATTGREQLAYVPSMLVPDLTELTDPSYQHRFYVDLTPTAMDVYFDNPDSSGSRWRTILAGGLGAGGQGVYALNITDPSTFDEANASDLVLWEIDDSVTPNLGYTFSRPVVARMHNGEWMAVFGNGFDNDQPDGNVGDGNARLYFVDMESGSIEREVVFPEAQADPSGVLPGANGIAAIALADRDGDLRADIVYAGDLLGNVWKVDVTDPTPANWTTSFGTDAAPNPMFIATDSAGVRQPITGPLAVRTHPTNQGQLVVFGTGKYFEVGDEVVVGSPQTQSVYGVWDVDDSALVNTSTGRSDLQAQEIIGATQAPDGSTVRVVSDDPMQWFDASGAPDQMGWLLDLVVPGRVNQGERVVTAPVIRDNRVLVSTLEPSDHACDFGGSGFIMELDVRNGGRLEFSPFDLDANNDGLFNLQDFVLMDVDGDGVKDRVPASGRRSDVGIPSAPTVLQGGPNSSCPAGECKYVSGSSGNVQQIINNVGFQIGRQGWRELR